MACVVLATTRANVNGLVRKHVNARRASFAPMDEAVADTGMEHGGITPLGLPGEAVAQIPGAQILDGLGLPAPA